jgi:hypothetical protein
VDYGLLDATGGLLGNPVHYRDSRTAGVRATIPPAELYVVTGIQELPINTIYQLIAAVRTCGTSPRLVTAWRGPPPRGGWVQRKRARTR